MELNKERVKSSLNKFKEHYRTGAITRTKIDININESFEIVKEIGKGLISDFVIDNDNKFLYENILKWVNGDNTMKAINPMTKKVVNGDILSGLYIAGPTGTGKTMCMEIIKIYAKIVGAKIHFKPEDEPRKLSWNNVYASQISKLYEQTGDISEYEKQRILCIQDFGCESDRSMYMGNTSVVLRDLLERRGDEWGKMLLVTSNLPLKHDMTNQKYGDRAVSRLCQMCNYFELRGKDRRMN